MMSEPCEIPLLILTVGKVEAWGIITSEPLLILPISFKEVWIWAVAQNSCSVRFFFVMLYTLVKIYQARFRHGKSDIWINARESLLTICLPVKDTMCRSGLKWLVSYCFLLPLWIGSLWRCVDGFMDVL